jgi:HK97 family phage portal protein
MKALAKQRRSNAIEARVTQPATVPGEARQFIVTRNNSGVFVDEHVALTYTAVWRGINLISFAMAMMTWGVFLRTAAGRTRLTTDPLHWLLNYQASDELGAFWLRATLFAHVLGWGNGYGEIERTRGGAPLAVHVVTPNRVMPDRDSRGNLVYVITNPRQPNTTLEPIDVLHLRGPGFDGLVGYSPFRMFRNNIGLALAAERASAGLFGNGANPGGVISSDKPVKPETMRALRESWNELHQGPDAAGRIAILEDGMKWSQVSTDPQVAQLIETRKFGVLDVARILNLPPHKLFDLDRATFSNIEEQNIDFVTNCLLPWAKIGETEADIKLLGRDRVLAGHYSRINLEYLLRGNASARATFYDKLFKMAALSVNEIRELEDLDPVPGGDLRMVPMNMCPLEKAMLLPMKDNSGGGGPDKGGPPDGKEESDAPSSAHK